MKSSPDKKEVGKNKHLVLTKTEYGGKFRIKLTDKCNLNCPFCHAEGSPKAEDISVNDPELKRWLKILRNYFDKVHLTGGEPILFKDLSKFCRLLKKLGYEIYLTTNGVIINNEFVKSLPFLSKINISFHTINPSYFREFLRNKKDILPKINKIKNNILYLKNNFGNVCINAVVAPFDNQKINEILKFAIKNNIYLKLIPDWRFYNNSLKYIEKILKDNHFYLDNILIKNPSSNIRKIFINKKGYKIELKDLKRYYPDFLCKKCELKKSCLEAFAFLRLEGNPIRFKPCLYKPSIKNSEFKKKLWPLIQKELLKSRNIK